MRHESSFVMDFFCSWSSWLAQRELIGTMMAVNTAVGSMENTTLVGYML